MKKNISFSAKQTQRMGELLGQELLMSKKEKQAIIIGLEGNLGDGKTTFIQGMAKGLKIKDNILSPTFVIFKEFNINVKNCDFKHFYHIDCYRLDSYKDLLELGLEDVINNPENIIVIEWANKIKDCLGDMIEIKFNWLDKNKREIIFWEKGCDKPDNENLNYINK